MTKLEIELHETVVSVINKIKTINDSGIELVIPKDAVLLENIINLKLIKEVADNLEIEVIFTTEDPYGQNMLENLEEKGAGTTAEELEGLGLPVEESQKATTSLVSKFKFKNLALPKLNFALPGKKNLIIVVLTVIPFVLYFWAGMSLPRANVKVMVEAQPHTRSLTVRVISSGQTDAKKKTLKGYPVTTELESSLAIDTTGEKIIGEKAKGKAIIYNTTDAAITIKKGTSLSFKDSKKVEYKFLTSGDVEVPAATKTPDTANPGAFIGTSGQAEVSIEAENIGDNYNVSDKKSLSVKGYDSDDVNAAASGNITGGKSEKVKAVSAADLQNIKDTLAKQDAELSDSTLKKKITTAQKLISGSISMTVMKETFSAKLGDETDKLTLTRMSKLDGLVYATNELKQFVDALMSDLVPADYELKEKTPDISVTILGNTNSSIVTSTEADIEVTVKVTVVPIIDTEAVKIQLMGQNPEDAQQIISQIKNIKTYEFTITPSIPLFKRVPKDVKRITVEVGES